MNLFTLFARLFEEHDAREARRAEWAAQKDREWQTNRQRDALAKTLALEVRGYTFPWWRLWNPTE